MTNQVYSKGDMPEYKVTTTCDGCKERMEWISVKDRLPEHDDELLVTWTGIYAGNHKRTKPLLEIVEYEPNIDGLQGGVWLCEPLEARGYSKIEVIAWMPLPEPYEVEPQESEV